ncbi:uncharacterized protein LOC121737706 [Aricia agestis]|uniref:uncharacterized protein LOC121737706 n=1 Tax=Aricia agestis TaxID=91739 RepID=UPI001C207612|nr:uncharacterized protein LOC121737706 [Aricia agestis]XP_041985322.1 uncharacterized protein LOC121737706 [Aricia agestis]
MSLKMESLQVRDVVKIFEHWNMREYISYIRENRIDGRKIVDLSRDSLEKCPDGVERFMTFVEDMKRDPKYLNFIRNEVVIKETNLIQGSQYQTVSVRKISQDNSNLNTVEEILKRITIPKRFLYRNQQKRTEKAMTSYVPMDKNPQRKKFFRLSIYDYPIFDNRPKPKPDDADRGYYCINTKTEANKTYKKVDLKPKYKSLPMAKDDFDERISDDHFYEDLCYNDMYEKKVPTQEKPRLAKIQELFQSFKFPFFKKAEVVEEKEKEKVTEEESNVYENEIVETPADAMYDSVHPATDVDVPEKSDKSDLKVEEYLEPVVVNRDYCDVSLKQKDDSLLSYIMSYFETRFGRRETHETALSESEEPVPDSKWERKSNMAARPLPVPVENESFYMNVDRREAEDLLLGQPDGAFILRPSSQPNHAYTLSVACSNSVHNVGIRRRADGRLALGFSRRGERSFPSVAALLQHHRKRRLLLVAGGDLIGATILNDTPQYYQTPKSLPIAPKDPTHPN